MSTNNVSTSSVKALNKETREFLNSELDRLHKLLTIDTLSDERAKWAMDRISDIQKAVLGLASLNAADLAEAANAAAQAAQDLNTGT